jgi:Fur family ferric uptake transcriptional regulator
MLQSARQAAPRLGIATVYRTIRNMLGEGTLAVVRIPGEVPRYELRRQDHRHYFRCRRCRGVFALQGCPGNFNAIVPRGFSLEDHELVLYGACRRCRTGRQKPARRKTANASASLAPRVRLTGTGRRAVPPVARKDQRL